MFKKGREITISIAGLLLLIAGVSIIIIFLRDKLIKKLDNDTPEKNNIKKQILNQIFKSRPGQFITWGIVALASAAFIIFISYIMRFPKYRLVGTTMSIILLASSIMLVYFTNEIRKTLNDVKEEAQKVNMRGIYDDFDKIFKGTLYTTIGNAGILGLFILFDQNFTKI